MSQRGTRLHRDAAATVGSEMAARIAAFDWSRTPVGDPQSWPRNLQTALQIMVASRHPMFIWWGEDLIQFYNDGYCPLLGERHPQALGQPAASTWADVWPVVGPQAEAVLRHGASTWNEERLLWTERKGFREETYFTFSYSPIHDDAGRVGGVFCAVSEETGRVLARRRLKSLRELGARTAAEARAPEQACRAAVENLAANRADLPFVLVYLNDAAGAEARLAAAAHVMPETPACPQRIALAAPDAPWPFAGMTGGDTRLVAPLPRGCAEGLAPAPRQALVLAIPRHAPGPPAGYLVAGLSPQLDFDDEYRGFLELAVRHVATAIDHASAYQEERRRAEILAELEAKFATAFDQTPLALTITSLETGRLVEVNAGFQRLTGYAREEALGRTPDELGLWVDPEQRAARFALLSTGQRAPEVEARFRIKSGEVLVGVVASAMIEIGGKACILTSVTDITERKRAEEALRASEQRLSEEVMAMNRLHEFTVRLMSVPRLSAALEEALAATMELVAADFGNVQLLDPDTQTLRIAAQRGFGPRFLEHFREVQAQDGSACASALAGGQRVVVEDVEQDAAFASLRGQARDAGFRAVQSTPLVSRRGDVLGVLSTHFRRPRRLAERELRILDLYVRQVTDLIERLRDDERLHASEARFRMLVEQVKDYAIFMTDASGRATSWNEGVKRVLGFDENEFLNTNLSPVIFTPEDFRRGVPEREMDEAARTGSASNDRWMRRKDGSHFWASGITTALRDQDGKLIGFTKVMRDQTERWQLEQQLEERAAALLEADRRKDEFLASLAHELRNPLAPLRNGLHIMALAPDDAPAAAQARAMMERQLGQLVRLVDDLLDVSRISRGKIELRRAQVALATIIEGALETVEPAIRSAGLHLELHLPDQPVHLHADATRLMQAIANLLSNSAKFTPRGGSVRLSVERHGAEVAIRVADTGVGIPPAMLPRIFDLFVQVDRSLERPQAGLGIGLTIVRRLVEMHGGRIEAHSGGAGKGSAFTIHLPVIAADEVAVAPPPQPVRPSRRQRILVVDDNRDAALSLATSLELLDQEVRTAFSGREALDVGASFAPEVVLLDIGMPELNGYETAQQIRQQAWGRTPALVALTGFGQEADRRRSERAGFDRHLVKPVEAAAVLALLAEEAQRPAAGGASSSSLEAGSAEGDSG